jgi:anti-anti-sigma regulatory factor
VSDYQHLRDDALAGVTAPGVPDPGYDLERVELSEEERQRFSALVKWSYGDDWFAAEPLIDQDCATLVLRGEIDALALPEIRSLLELLVDARPVRLCVDLADAAFISVSAMLCMVDAARHIPEVVIARPSSTLRRIFELVDPDRRLTLGTER